MRWVTFTTSGTSRPIVGRLVDDLIYALRDVASLTELMGDDGERLARSGETAVADPALVAAVENVRLLAPIPRPASIRDFFAFEQHVRRTRENPASPINPDWYRLPVFYFQNPHATVGPDDHIAIPPDCHQLDFELEVAAIVGRAGTNLSPSEADRYIAGYTIMNDWSARDVQRRESAVSLGPAKAKDFATTLGPWLVTPDEIESLRSGVAYDVTMSARVNGREYSRASLASVYWSFGEMIAYATRGARVDVGDVIASGTCGTGCILELSGTHGSEAFP